MIKRIQIIKNFGVYNDYKHNGNLRDFNDKNIFYGWNYSGKTTLSRLFSYLERGELNTVEFPSVEFEIILKDNSKINQTNIESFPFNVRVFNSDFIKENLRFDSEDKKMKGIAFDIGKNAHLRPLIKTNEEYIEKAKEIVKSNSIFIKKFNEFSESKFSKQAKIIKNDHFNSLIEFNKTHLDKLIITKEGALEDIIGDETELVKIKANSIANGDKEKIEINENKISFNHLSKIVSDFIAREPLKTNTIQSLDEDIDLYNWVNRGLELHNSKNLNDCAFCKSAILQNRKSELNAYFSNEAAKLKDDSVELLKAIDDEINLFFDIDIIKISKNDISESLQGSFVGLISEYHDLQYRYIGFLNKLKNAVTDKIYYNIFIKKELPLFDTNVFEELAKWLHNVIDTISKHNDIVSDFKSNQDNSREKYKKHLVASYLIDENYFEIKRKKEVEEKYHQKLNIVISDKEIQNKENKDKLTSITAGKKELNDFIKLFLRREDILIDVIEDNYFILKRGTEIAKNLSEGEKTAIAFSHFMVILNSLHNDGKLLDTVVFIDDPISSLDANHIAQISSMINQFFFRKGIDIDKPEKIGNCFLQLFISTHNFEFYSFLRDANNIKRAKKELQGDGSNKDVKSLNSYLIKKETTNTSQIINLPSSLLSFKSEYVYLFSIIYDFYESKCSEENTHFILMPNAIRRFLEIYTLIKLPGNTGEIDSRVKELVGDVSELKILHHFSHFTTFEKATKHDELILRLPELTEDMFTLLKKDTPHYTSLCQAINKVLI